MAVSVDLGRVLDKAYEDKSLKEILAAPRPPPCSTTLLRQGIGKGQSALSLTPCAIAINDPSVLHGVLIEAKHSRQLFARRLVGTAEVKRVCAALIEAKHG